MNMARRKLLTRVLEGLAVTLVFLDIATYFAVLRPLQDRVQEEQTRHRQARATLAPVRNRVERLQKYASELPTADGQIAKFLEKHVPERRSAYSTADSLVAKLAEKSGVQLTAVGYKPESEHKNPNPLRWLRIEVGAEGGFKNLMDFAYGLESGDQFLLIRNVAFDMGDKGQPSLRLAADLYVTP
jgi:Tfp pilus assembly protein PilO